MRNAHKILVVIDEERQLGRPSRRWEDDNKMYLKGIRFEDWTGFIWLRIGSISRLL
jgi:hypothetical protein